MAITFRGSCVTGPITANTSGEIVLSIECTPYSKAKVDVIGIIAQLDSLAVATAAGHIMPLFRARKVTGVTSGGAILTGKAAFDTQQASDPGVIIRQSLGRSGGGNSPISSTGTPVTVKETFSSRNATIYGQEMHISELCIAHRPSGGHLYLAPGEALLVTWDNGTRPVGGEAFFNIAWEEDSLGTEYTVSGQVTLSSSPVTGAKIILVTDTDRDLPAPVVEVIATDGSGNWTKTLAAGIKADAFVQHRSGETLYTAEGKPYLAKP